MALIGAGEDVMAGAQLERAHASTRRGWREALHGSDLKFVVTRIRTSMGSQLSIVWLNAH